MAAPPLPFWCHICEVDCLTAINLQTHFLDVKHLKLEGAIEEYTQGQEAPEEPNPQGAASEDDPTPTPPSNPPLNLEEQLDGCRSTEPAIGLEYVEEHQCPGKALKYVCTLCDCEEPTNNMFMHVVGNRHRLAYLTKHYPERSRVPGKGDELNKILRQFAAAVEARDGRKKIRVVTESRPSKRKAEEEDEEANENGFSIGPYVDSSLEDTPVAQGPGALFLELKKAHEESVKERDQERAASIIDIFTSNTELLEYLDNFEVASEDDVVFVLVVNERFTSALTEYQTRCETKTHQELCTAEEPQNVWYKQVPVSQTNSLPLPYNIAACSKPASYNPWILTPEVFCTNPALCSAAGSIAPPNNIANAIAYHNPAFPPPNELPNVKYENPVCYNFTPLPLPPPIPLPLPPPPISLPLPPPIPLPLPPPISYPLPPPISYPLPPPITYPLPPPIHFPPPEVPPVVMAEQPVCYNSTSQSSVPQPTPLPIVLSAKPVYYNITKASDSETKTVNEKVVKGPTNRTAVPFKKAKKENPNLAVTGFVFSFN